MAESPLIPRKILFGNADKASVQLSPDGTHIAWLAPLDGGHEYMGCPAQ